MKIKCPHCHGEFNSKSAILKGSKDEYRWYEFSRTNSFCPICNKQYQIDFSKIGVVLVLLFLVLSWIAISMWGDLVLIPLSVIAMIVVNVFPHILIKVESR